MKVHDIYVVSVMIKLYEKSKSAAEVAAKLKIPKADVLALLDWVWERQEQVKRVPKCGIGVGQITERQYLQYLYENNVSAEAAADAVQWPLSMVLLTCGGEQEWRKQSGRAPTALRQDDPEYVLGDPPAAIVEQELEKLRSSWPAHRLNDYRPYEIPQGVDLGLVNFD